MRVANRQSLRNAVAWVGLFLMLICFTWLQLTPPPEELPTSERTPSAAGNKIALVIIDAGHGGQDSGAMRNGVLEKDLTLNVALRVEGLARARGFRTLLTRPNDSWISLAARAAAANRENDCVFVSIHFDEGSKPTASGVQTFYALHSAAKPPAMSWLPFLQPILPQRVNFESQSLAGFVQEGLVTRTHALDRGTRPEQFFVIANLRHPAILVEGGFLTNDEDLARLADGNYREDLAAGIIDGVVRYRELVKQRGQTLALRSATP